MLLLLSLLFRSLAAGPRVVLNNNNIHFVLLRIVMYIIIIMCPFNVRAFNRNDDDNDDDYNNTGPTTKVTFPILCAHTENENDFARNSLRRRYYINIVNLRRDRPTILKCAKYRQLQRN